MPEIREWMVSLNAEVTKAPEDALDRLVDELEKMAAGSSAGVFEGGLGTTITVYAPTHDEAGRRGRGIFQAALRLAGVTGEVVKVEVGTYDDAGVPA